MGILPLQFAADQSATTLKLTGAETYDFTGLGTLLTEGFPKGKSLSVKATRADGSSVAFTTTIRIDTPQELQYYRHGGILEYVLRQLASQSA
jgi:aconitate hydratase